MVQYVMEEKTMSVQAEMPSVLLVSIDALKPEFVFEQKRLGVELPVITRYFVEN